MFPWQHQEESSSTGGRAGTVTPPRAVAVATTPASNTPRHSQHNDTASVVVSVAVTRSSSLASNSTRGTNRASVASQPNRPIKKDPVTGRLQIPADKVSIPEEINVSTAKLDTTGTAHDDDAFDEDNESLLTTSVIASPHKETPKPLLGGPQDDDDDDDDHNGADTLDDDDDDDREKATPTTASGTHAHDEENPAEDDSDDSSSDDDSDDDDDSSDKEEEEMGVDAKAESKQRGITIPSGGGGGGGGDAEKDVSVEKPKDLEGLHDQHHLPADSDDSDEDSSDEDSDDDTSSSEESSEDSEDLVPTSRLPDGAFTFIITAPFCSTPFMTAMFIFFLETTIFALIAANLTSGPPGNPLGLPASVSAPVILSQFFALLIAVTTQDDVISALNLIYEGYQKESLEEAFDHVTRFKWILSVGLLLLEGILGLSITFLLIVTSPDVVTLLLNFTAVEFVSLLDNGTFLLAQQGFLGDVNKAEADEISETEYDVPRSRKAGRRLQILMLTVSYLILLVGWAIIYAQQLSGLYTPRTLVVQFDDQIALRLGIFSGVYELNIQRRSFGFGRIRYVAKAGSAVNGMFAYCQSDQVWAFSETVNNDICGTYTARSDSSSNFDITTTMTNNWFVTGDVSQRRFYPMNNFQLAVGCRSDSDCGGTNRGQCVRNGCQCFDQYYGWRCDYIRTDTCANVQTVSGGNFVGNQIFATSYNALTDATTGKLVLAYDHPIYVGPLDSAGQGDVMFYTGLRWGLFNIPPNLVPNTNLSTPALLAGYFTGRTFDVEKFLAVQEFFVSQTVNIQTPQDVATPVGLSWERTLTSSNNVQTRVGSGASLLCAVCNNSTNPCGNNNTCPASGRCECTNGATGVLCDSTPVSNGFCDNVFFNQVSFTYDGGDCCEASCVSQNNNTCGFIPVANSSQLINVQYPHCRDPATECSPVGDSCWTSVSQPVPTLAATVGSMVLLGSSGRVLVEAVSTLENVKVFDRVDSRWVQRGGDLVDVRGSRFGVFVSLYTPEAYSLVDTGGVNVLLAIGLYRLNLAATRVVRYDSLRMTWANVGNEIALCTTTCTLTGVAMGSTGDAVHVAAGLDGTRVDVYESTLTATGNWRRTNTIAGNAFAMSGDGSVLAVLSNSTMDQISIYPLIGNATAPFTVGVNTTTPGLLSVQDMRLSFDGSLLTVVFLSSDMNDIVASVQVTNKPGTTKMASAPIGPLSRRSLGSGFNPVALSTDGSGLLVAVDTPPGPVLRAYRYRETVLGWEQAGDDFVGVTLDAPFAISSEAAILASGKQTNINVTALSPRCPPGTVSYRLSIPLGLHPKSVSWALQSFRMVGNTKVNTGMVDESCNGCYSDETNYASALINAEGCMSPNDCLTLAVSDSDSSDGGTPMYLFQQEQMVWNGTAGVGQQNFTIGTQCALQAPACAAGETVFALALTLDKSPDETSWSLSVNGTAPPPLLQGGNYSTASLTSPTIFEQQCVSTSDCLNFAIADSGGDGTCCDVGDGRYSLFLNDTLVESRTGDQFPNGERIQFGSCPVSITGGLVVGLTLQLDNSPGDISWYIEDTAGVRHDQSSIPANTGATSVTSSTKLFSEDVNGCLFFFIQDSQGDGISGGGYTLELNGQVLTTRSGNFRFGERVRFGTTPNCATQVTRSSNIFVQMLMDGRPTQNSWYLGNSTGGVLNSITYGVPGNARSVINIRYDPIQDNNPENCYSFTINDSGGDGTCCDFGQGTYSIRLGWTTLVTRRGSFGFGERITFGQGCPFSNNTEPALEIARGYAAQLDLTLDFRPNQTSWQIRDPASGTGGGGELLDGVSGTPLYDNITADYARVGSSAGALFSPIRLFRTIFRFPPRNTADCLDFSIVDSNGDGICCNNGNGTYSLSVNGVVRHSSNGNFGFGETVRFGRLCPVTVAGVGSNTTLVFP